MQADRGSTSWRWARRAAAAACAALALFGCGGDVTGPSDLEGTQWQLAELRIDGGAPQAPPDPSRFVVDFDAAGRIGARADCNVCGGRYTLSGETFRVQDLACTLAFCASAPFDGHYLAILTDATALDLDGGDLEIRSPRGTLRFRR